MIAQTTKQTVLINRIPLALCLLLPFAAPASAAELRITSIQRQDDCTTLTWDSQPGEFYTVYWTDALDPNIFWRVAAMNVPSGGTNTIWSECGSEGMAAQGGGSSATSTTTLSAEERAALFEESRAKAQQMADELFKMLEEATERARQKWEALKSGQSSSTTAASSTEGGGAQMSVLNTNVSARFYRVARTAVTGFVDGWGVTLGSIPTNVAASPSPGAIAVSASPRDRGAHSLVLLTNETVTAWGSNSFGQCNVPTNLVDVVAIAAGGRHSMALRQDGTVVIWGDTSLGQITNAPASLTNVVAIAAGIWHSMALRADGAVAAWGDLFNGTNSVPADLSNVTAIAAGPRHCLALRSDGTVAAWGFDYSFLQNFLPTNVPATLSNVVAISAGMTHNQALLRNGTVQVWGQTNNPAVANTPAGLTNLLANSAGWHYGLAIGDDSSLIYWGQDESAP